MTLSGFVHNSARIQGEEREPVLALLRLQHQKPPGTALPQSPKIADRNARPLRGATPARTTNRDLTQTPLHRMPYPDTVQLSINGQTAGPFSADVVRSMLGTGSISPTDYAWAEGMPEWVTVEAYLQDAPVSPAATATAIAAAETYVERAPAGGVTFPGLILDALAYPFRGDGLLILILGTLLFTVLNFLGSFSIYLPIAGWGYLLLMLQEVVHGTASGEKTVPNWPDFDGFGELLGKWFQFFATLAVCFGPGAFLAGRGGSQEDATMFFGGVGLMLLGLVYCPMALLSVAMYDSLGGLNPVLVVKSIFAIPGHYLLTLVVLGIVVVIQIVTTSLSQIVPYAGHLLDELDALWSAVFVARVLGCLYKVNERRLNWF